jgi:hypothetical protein
VLHGLDFEINPDSCALRGIESIITEPENEAGLSYPSLTDYQYLELMVELGCHEVVVSRE